MASGQHLDDYVRYIVAAIHRDHSDWTAKRVHQALHDRLKREHYPRKSAAWPSLSAIQKQMGKIREAESERGLDPDPEDRPWCVVSLAKYDMPPEALPVVLEAWAKSLVANTPLTIREAKWVARLVHIVSDLDALVDRAMSYAAVEATMQEIGRYPTKPETFAKFLWDMDTFLYRDKQPHDPELERRLMEKYGGMEYNEETGRYRLRHTEAGK